MKWHSIPKLKLMFVSPSLLTLMIMCFGFPSLLPPSIVSANVRAGGALNLRYTYAPVSGFERPFKDNGLEQPPLFNTSLGGRGFVNIDDWWRVGAGGYSIFVYRHQIGSSEGRYSGAYFGPIGELYVRREKNIHYLAGLLLGYGSSQMKVTGSNYNAEVNQTFFALEPRVSVEFSHPSIKYLRGAGVLTYLVQIPTGRGDVGNGSTTNSLMSNGLSLGLELLIGIF